MPPSHTRWSKVSESWTTLRTASSPSCTHGLGDDPADAEHRRLGVVDDRRGAVDAEHPVVVQRERAAGQLGRGEAARPGRLGQPGELGGQLDSVVSARARPARPGRPGRARSARRSPRCTSASRTISRALGVHRGVELREAGQRRRADPGQQGEQRRSSGRPARVHRGPRGQQLGGVRVHPAGGVGDLAPAAGQLVGDGAADAAQRDARGRRRPGRPRRRGGPAAAAAGRSAAAAVAAARRDRARRRRAGSARRARSRSAPRRSRPCSRASRRTSGEITGHGPRRPVARRRPRPTGAGRPARGAAAGAAAAAAAPAAPCRTRPDRRRRAAGAPVP